MLVRRAKQQDLPAILRLYKKGLVEVDEKYLESLLVKKIVDSFLLAPCFLLEIDGRIQGMAGFTTVTIAHNGVASLADYMFYVEPEHRSMKTLGALVDAAKEFAREHEMPIRVDFISQNDEELRKRLLTRHGFTVALVVGVFDGKNS